MLESTVEKPYPVLGGLVLQRTSWRRVLTEGILELEAIGKIREGGI